MANRIPFAVVLLIAFVPLTACGDAESAPDDTSRRLTASETEMVEAPGEQVPPSVAPALMPARSRTSEPGGETAVDARPQRTDASVPIPTQDALTGPLAEPAAPANPLPRARVLAFVPAGTLLEATMEGELSTGRSSAGDRFFARLDEDVLGPDGLVLLAAGSTLNGRVVESLPSPTADQQAILAVEVESITSGGRTLPLLAEVVELEAEVEARDSDIRTAAKVGVGAVAGALIGRILGNNGKDAAKGAVAGAAAGAAVAIATRDGHAVVRPGARMVLRLSERLIVDE